MLHSETCTCRTNFRFKQYFSLRTKRIFEVFIGDPYKTAENDEEDLFEDSDSDFGPLSPVEQPPAPVLLRKPTPESLRLSLPVADDEDDDEIEMDTERY